MIRHRHPSCCWPWWRAGGAVGRFPWCVIACSSSVLWSLGKDHARCTLSRKELCSTSLIPTFISYCLLTKSFICVSKDAQIICFTLWIIIQLVFIFKLPVCVCMCMCVWLCVGVCVRVNVWRELGRFQIPWNRSSRQLWVTQSGYWEPSLGPLFSPHSY